MKQEIGFIGLGNMGAPMAINLHKSRYRVIAYDMDIEKAKKMKKYGIQLASCPSDVITPGGVLITMVSDDAAVCNVITGENGILNSLHKIDLHIAMSTLSPKTIEELSTIHKQSQIGFLSAPVLGRPDAAIAKKLWIFLSGESLFKIKAKSILECLGQNIYDFGDKISAAATIKLAINFMILSAIETMGEAFAFIKKNELDCNFFADMITQTLFSCIGYQYHAQNIVTESFSPAGFKMSLGLKDISLLLEKTQELSVSMPVADLLRKRLLSGLSKNRENLDWSAITLESLELAGLECITDGHKELFLGDSTT